MQRNRQSKAEDYRQRAARVRRGAEHARCGDVHDALLRLAAKYDEIADQGGEVLERQDNDATIMFRRVRCRLRSGLAVLYYPD